MGDVTIVVGTFGDDSWAELAHQRAIPSAEPQAPVVFVHGETLAAARNAGLAKVTTDHVVFLDADDELTDGYVATLLAGTADLRVPSVEYVRNGMAAVPRVPRVPGHSHDCNGDCMEDGNYAVIGSLANADRARAAGGFREEACYEDWSLWLRMVRAGATVESITAAIYRAHVRRDSRNRALPIDTKNRVHAEILEAAA